MNQISENILTAIDIVVQERLKNLSYDKTELCIILEQITSNKYLVEHKGLSFQAYGESVYSVGEQVYVTSPQNDSYSAKIIIGKYIKEPNTLSSVSLQDNLILFSEEKIDNILEIGNLITRSFSDYVNLPTHFGLFCDISCETISDNANFNLQINIYNKNNEIVQTDIFTQKDLLGNIKQLINSKQEKLFRLTANEINRLELNLTGEGFLSLSISNIYLRFGNHIKDYSTPGLYINTINNLEYTSENNNKLIYCSLIKQASNGILYKDTSPNFNWQDYIITSYLTEDMDAAWSSVSQNDIYHSFIFNVEKYPYKKIRAIENETNQISNILTFTNTSKSAPTDIFDTENLLGTEYELVVEMSTVDQVVFPKNIFTKSYSNYLLFAELRDKYSNAEITNSNDKDLKITYSLELSKNINLEEDSSQITVSDSSNKAYGILKAIATYLNKTYITYVSLGWRENENYDTFQGATIVIYNNNGVEPQWNQSAYELYKGAAADTNIIWSINQTAIGYPTITIDKKLKPYSSYVDSLSKDLTITAKNASTAVWIQPIILIKELLTEGETGDTTGISGIDNTILSALKSTDSGLSGVIIGQQDDKIGLFLLDKGNINSFLTNNTFLLRNQQLKLIGEEFTDTDYVIANQKYIDDNLLKEADIRNIVETVLREQGLIT